MGPQFVQIKEEDIKGSIAEQEVPHDVNPRDPDEQRYIYYDNWRDFEEGYAASSDEALEIAMTECYDYYEPQVSQW